METGCVNLLCREQSMMMLETRMARVAYRGRLSREAGTLSIPEMEAGREKHPLWGFDEPHAYTEGVCVLVWPSPPPPGASPVPDDSVSSHFAISASPP